MDYIASPQPHPPSLPCALKSWERVFSSPLELECLCCSAIDAILCVAEPGKAALVTAQLLRRRWDRFLWLNELGGILQSMPMRVHGCKIIGVAAFVWDT